MAEKACAIVLRESRGGAQVLLFRHPLAGVQLVKGSIKPGEAPTEAAVRELFEESGLRAEAVTYLRGIDFPEENQSWHICRCTVGQTPETWSHETVDDDGQRFAFFWHSLGVPLPDDTGKIYAQVIKAVLATL